MSSHILTSLTCDSYLFPVSILRIDYDSTLQKDISSQYGDHIFARFIQMDGSEYNVRMIV